MRFIRCAILPLLSDERISFAAQVYTIIRHIFEQLSNFFLPLLAIRVWCAPVMRTPIKRESGASADAEKSGTVPATVSPTKGLPPQLTTVSTGHVCCARWEGRGSRTSQETCPDGVIFTLSEERRGMNRTLHHPP